MKSSIATKVIGLIVLVFVISLALITFVYSKEANRIFENLYSDKAISLVQTLDANVSTIEDLRNRDNLQQFIYKMMWLNGDLFRLNINMPDKNNNLQVVASSDVVLIDSPSISENVQSLSEDRILTARTKIDNKEYLLVVTPLHMAGQVVGTYEMTLSLNRVMSTTNDWLKNQLIINFATMLFLVFFMYFVIQRLLLSPLRRFAHGMQLVQKGNLDYKLTIHSRDEIGRLSSIFNEMTVKLKEYKTQNENYKQQLEKQVQQKNQELTVNKQELEKQRENVEELSKRMKAQEEKFSQLNKDTMQSNPVTVITQPENTMVQHLDELKRKTGEWEKQLNDIKLRAEKRSGS